MYVYNIYLGAELFIKTSGAPSPRGLCYNENPYFETVLGEVRVKVLLDLYSVR